MARLHSACSEPFLPLLMGGLCADGSARISSAAVLLQRLEQSLNLQFQWQQYSSLSSAFVSLPPYESIILENALVENRNVVHINGNITLDITAAATTCTGLAHDIAPASSSASPSLRRVLRDHVRCGNVTPIHVWQHISDSQEWRQCQPWQCAQFQIQSDSADARLFRKLTIRPGSLCDVQIPHPFKTDP